MEKLKNMSHFSRIILGSYSLKCSPSGSFHSHSRAPNVSSVFSLYRSFSSLSAATANDSVIGVGTNTSEIADEEQTAVSLYEKIKAAMDAKVAPEKRLLHSFLNKCNSVDDVKLAFSTLSQLREENCAYRHQISNFKESVSIDLIHACIRAGVPKLALKALNRKNVYGLTPTITTMHLVLNHALMKKDIELLIEAFRMGSRNGNVKPTGATANIIFATYSSVDDVSRVLKMGKEFVGNGILLDASQHDVLIAAAANAGRKKQAIEEIAPLREAQSVPLTWHSAISMAKIHILMDDISRATTYIISNLPDKEKQEQFEMHMRQMFHTWPKRLPKDKHGECKALPLAKVRANLIELEKHLQYNGVYLPFTADGEFPDHLIKSGHAAPLDS